ncbi:MAG: 50S ribosomal protein L13 [Chloroflexi bacterium]|nr:50S ribosomal protein L13 [Chloroflexota bacterium]
MRTYSPKIADIKHRWQVLDARDQTLGRLAVTIATILKGKHKPQYSPHIDVGDYVVVINAEKVRVSGKKRSQKVYYRHTMYPGGLRQETLAEVLSRHPARAIEHAVRGMLPRSPLGSSMMRKLKVYVGEAHPHEAQMSGGGKEEKHDSG